MKYLIGLLLLVSSVANAGWTDNDDIIYVLAKPECNYIADLVYRIGMYKQDGVDDDEVVIRYLQDTTDSEKQRMYVLKWIYFVYHRVASTMSPEQMRDRVLDRCTVELRKS